ncbi:MAG TPA: hypothetical protein VJH03_20740 [Blastocatellia bacterium]|nr:hypothetical protein [Blastocatellia bacterium]
MTELLTFTEITVTDEDVVGAPDVIDNLIYRLTLHPNPPNDWQKSFLRLWHERPFRPRGEPSFEDERILIFECHRIEEPVGVRNILRDAVENTNREYRQLMRRKGDEQRRDEQRQTDGERAFEEREKEIQEIRDRLKSR